MEPITAEQAVNCADMLIAWAKQEGLDRVRMRSSGEESTVADEIEELMEWVHLFAGIIKAGQEAK